MDLNWLAQMHWRFFSNNSYISKQKDNSQEKKVANKIASMDAYNRFTKCIYTYERILLQIVGHDVLAAERVIKRTPMTFITYLAIFLSFTMEIYTIIYYGILAKIFGLSTFSVTVQVSRKQKTSSHLCRRFWWRSKRFGTVSGSCKIVQCPPSRWIPLGYWICAECIQSEHHNQMSQTIGLFSKVFYVHGDFVCHPGYCVYFVDLSLLHLPVVCVFHT